MRNRIGGCHSRLLCLLAFLFSMFLVGFAKPRDPRVTAIVVPDLGGETVESAARKHLTRADGVVLYVALAEHKMRIETGPQARRSLSDTEAQAILDQRMRPLLREGRTDAAVDEGVAAIEQALARGPAPQSTQRPSGLGTFAWVFIAVIGILFVGIVALAAASASANGSRETRRRRVVHDDGTITFVHVPVHTPHVDTSGGGGFSGGGDFSGGGGASSSW